VPIFDYLCPQCELKLIDVLVSRYDKEVLCSECGTVTSKLPAMLAIKNLNTQEKVSAALKKRSLDHSRKNKEQALHQYKKQIVKATKGS